MVRKLITTIVLAMPKKLLSSKVIRELDDACK